MNEPVFEVSHWRVIESDGEIQSVSIDLEPQWIFEPIAPPPPPAPKRHSFLWLDCLAWMLAAYGLVSLARSVQW